ncbi:MAG: hypothetical protein DRO11_02975 [Methanobacteriota archaeon]|nr:MAG: hypothetical protein DRO11_02975 [Euryarchaeota archaeon]
MEKWKKALIGATIILAAAIAIWLIGEATGQEAYRILPYLGVVGAIWGHNLIRAEKWDTRANISIIVILAAFVFLWVWTASLAGAIWASLMIGGIVYNFGPPR